MIEPLKVPKIDFGKGKQSSINTSDNVEVQVTPINLPNRSNNNVEVEEMSLSPEVDSSWSGTINEAATHVATDASSIVNGIIDRFKIEKGIGTTTDSTVKPMSLEEAIAFYGERENMVMIEVNGEYYYVVDTPLPVTQLQEYWRAKGMSQDAGFARSQCDMTAKYGVYDLLWGIPTSKDGVKTGQMHQYAKEGPYKSINNLASSPDDQSVIWNFVYDQLSKGNPVALTVNQTDTNSGDNRHVVTVVGMLPDVKSAADLNTSNILVLDNVDAELKTIPNKYLILREGTYQAIGPSEEFLKIRDDYQKTKQL